MTLGKDKSLAVVECSRISIGTILEDVFRLFFIDIQTDPGELVQADALDKILGLDQSAPGSVTRMTPSFIFLMV